MLIILIKGSCSQPKMVSSALQYWVITKATKQELRIGQFWHLQKFRQHSQSHKLLKNNSDLPVISNPSASRGSTVPDVSSTNCTYSPSTELFGSCNLAKLDVASSIDPAATSPPGRPGPPHYWHFANGCLTDNTEDVLACAVCVRQLASVAHGHWPKLIWWSWI